MNNEVKKHPDVCMRVFAARSHRSDHLCGEESQKMNDKLLDKAIEELGFDSVIYILLWGMIGLGTGCMIGYTTKSVIKENE